MWDFLAQRLRNDRPRAGRRKKHNFSTLDFETLEERWLLSIESIQLLNPTSMTGTTSDKPQSKVWEHNDTWWSVYSTSTGTYLHRLDSGAWTQVLRLSSHTSMQADIKSAGDMAYILMVKPSEVQLATVQYFADGARAYEFVDGGPGLVTLPFNNVETATIDLDSTGRLWVAYDTPSRVEVRYSDGNYSTWSDPIVLAQNIKDDDITTITALPNGSIGVLWSDQNARRFGFRTHVDGTDPTLWTANEVPAGHSALNVGGGMADDHLNVAVAPDGTLYAAVKTSYDRSDLASVGLLVRRPNGQWDQFYGIDVMGTRPAVQLNEATGTLLYSYRSSDTAGPILYREIDTATMSIGAAEVLFADPALEKQSSTKQNFTDDLVIIASAGGTLVTARLFSTLATNHPPFVFAGEDLHVFHPESVTLSGFVTDDNLPNPPGQADIVWSVVSGPGNVTFGNAFALETTAAFSTPGEYTLRLTASDGEFTRSDDVVVTVLDPSLVSTVTFRNGPTYSGTTDTKINATNPNSTYRAASTLEADGSPDIATLIKWDLSSIPIGSTVQTASITIHVTNSSVDSFELYEMKRPWDERRASWNVYDANTPWQVAGAQGENDRGSTVLGQITATATGTYTLVLNSAGLALVQRWVNDPSSNHGFMIFDYDDRASDGMLFYSSEATTPEYRPGLTVTYQVSGPVINAPPEVDAGPDQSLDYTDVVTLAGTASDDGFPNPPGTLTYLWSVLSGLGAVSFGDTSSLTTTATFSTPGDYVLRLTVSDGELSRSDDVKITVTAPNQVPIVSAGADQTTPQDGAVLLEGSVSDDGLPDPPGLLTFAWTVVSGPGEVAFDDASAAVTSATFSMPGEYVLRLTASDGEYEHHDDVTITVTSLSDNEPPTVNAGADQSITLPNSAQLSGIATDDGHPNPPATLTTQWSLVSGPAGVTFDDASALATAVHFTTAGRYVLRLTVNDGELERSDDVIVNVLAASPPTTVTFQDGPDYSGTRDTKIRADRPDATFRAASTLEADGSPDVATLIAWNLSSIPAGSTITGVKTTIYITNATADAFALYEVKKPWDEARASWNEYASGSAWEVAGAQGTSDRGNTVLGEIRAAGEGFYTVELNAAGLAVVQKWVNDPSSNHGFTIANYDDLAADGVLFYSREANDIAQRPALTITYQAPAQEVNQPPQVNAGPDQTILQTGVATLNGTATDDGLPASPGVLSYNWSVVSGPGEVAFHDPSAAGTTATFSLAGEYVLQLLVSDGEHTTTDTLVVTVVASGVNQSPVVDAGPDRSITQSERVLLEASVTDDGLPDPPGALTLLWSKFSGPGEVVFTHPLEATTSATFSAPGQYVLRLTVSDSEFSRSDDVVVTVTEAMTTVTFQDGSNYSGTRDTKIRADRPDSTFRAASTLEADGSPDIATLIAWDLSSVPAGSTITNVTIKIYVTNSSTDTYALYEAKKPWDEARASWNQYASDSSWETPGAQGASDRGDSVLGEIVAAGEGYYTVQLNAAGLAVVQKWVNDHTTNNGFVIFNYDDAAADGLLFRSREADDPVQRPALTITYTRTPGAPAPLMSFASLSATSSPEADADDRLGIAMSWEQLHSQPELNALKSVISEQLVTAAEQLSSNVLQPLVQRGELNDLALDELLTDVQPQLSARFETVLDEFDVDLALEPEALSDALRQKILAAIAD